MNRLDIFSVSATRDNILALQDSIAELDQVDLPVKHYFAPGLYCREIFMPSGSVVVGKIHKHSHMNVISKGKVRVSTEFGNEEFIAPHSFVSLPGTKRAVYVMEDCIWTTFHPTNETDLEKIEDHVIAKSFEEYDSFIALSCDDKYLGIEI